MGGEEIRERVVRGTVASPRLDAVAGLGFGVSRSRMAREIKAERVRLNGETVTDTAKPVTPGDVIGLEGRGEATLDELSGPTRKGRLGATLTRRYGGQASM